MVMHRNDGNGSSNGKKGKTMMVGQIKGQKLPPLVGEFLAVIAVTLDEVEANHSGSSTPEVQLVLHGENGEQYELSIMRKKDAVAMRRRANIGDMPA